MWISANHISYSNMEQDALWLRVEEDVEKKRHVKDPFREPYVELVSASFDRFIRLPLHNTEELQTEEQSCSSVQNEDDPVTLRQGKHKYFVTTAIW